MKHSPRSKVESQKSKVKGRRSESKKEEAKAESIKESMTEVKTCKRVAGGEVLKRKVKLDK